MKHLLLILTLICTGLLMGHKGKTDKKGCHLEKGATKVHCHKAKPVKKEVKKKIMKKKKAATVKKKKTMNKKNVKKVSRPKPVATPAEVNSEDENN